MSTAPRQHTPGPWFTGGCGEDGWHMILGPKTRFYHAFGEAHTTSIAYISVSDSEAEDLANARLIAAAPDTTERLSITTHMLENLVADMRTGKRFSEQAVANVHMVIEANRAAIARATSNQ